MRRWVDLNEPDLGVALLNDCKYAYDCLEQSVRLTLVRGSTFPDPQADLGEHRLHYALFVHDGIADLADVQRAAEAFDNPIAVIGAGAPAPTKAADLGHFSVASVDQDNVTLETVTKAETSDALVMRVFEHTNRRANATIAFGFAVKSVRSDNLMEEVEALPLTITDNKVTLSL